MEMAKMFRFRELDTDGLLYENKVLYGILTSNGDAVSAQDGTVYPARERNKTWAIEEPLTYCGAPVWIDVEREVLRLQIVSRSFSGGQTDEPLDRTKAVQVCYKSDSKIRAGILLPDNSIISASDGSYVEGKIVHAGAWENLNYVIQREVDRPDECYVRYLYDKQNMLAASFDELDANMTCPLTDLLRECDDEFKTRNVLLCLGNMIDGAVSNFFTDRAKRYRKFQVVGKEYSFICPTSLEDVIANGRSLNHSARDYFGSYATSEFGFEFFLRKTDAINTPYVTVDVVPDNISHPQKLQVVRIAGMNGEIESVVWDLVEAWIEDCNG